MTTAAHYRTTALMRRKRQTTATIHKKSQMIEEKLLSMPQTGKAAHIFFIYINFRSEVETRHLISVLLKKGKTVSVPLCHPEKHQMEAIAIENLDQLVSGAWGIPEPPPKLASTSRVDPAIIDIIVMPGAAFDCYGGRVGYGGGFYDRFVARVPQAQRIGLAFELQIVPRIPLAPHDALVDSIVTERRIIPAGRGKLVNYPVAR